MATRQRALAAGTRRLLGLATVAAVLTAAAGVRAQDGDRTGGFTIAPYLVEVTAHEATVAFELPGAQPAVVRLGTDAEGRDVRSDQAQRLHFVRVTGLSPGRTYPYQVTCPGGACATPGGDERFQIRTAALPGESFTFTVYGDPRPGENQTDRHHRLVVEQMLEMEPAFSLVLGDMVDDGSDARLWQQFFEVERELRSRAAIFPVLGDNDVAEGRGLAGRYFPVASRGPYRFEWGEIQFFGMNAWGTRGQQPDAELSADSSQVRWLEQQLATDAVRRAPFRVVFLHDPIVISRGRSAELLERVWAPLLERGRVDLVFASWHLYERLREQGVTYVVTGGAGAELVWLDPNPRHTSQAEAKRHHVCRVDVKPGALQLRAVAEDGTVLDSLTLLPRDDSQQGASTKIRRLAQRLRRDIDIGTPTDEPPLELLLFSYECSYCRRLLEQDLPRWAREQAVALRIHFYDLAVPGAYDLLMAAGADFGRQDADIPTLFVGRRVLGGEPEIVAGLPGELARFRDDRSGYREQAFVPFQEPRDTTSLRTERFEALNVWLVLAAGLLDGVNPCAFTTIIFLLSYLSLAGGRRRQLLVTGLIFTAAVFVTYLAIGVLFYELASSVMGNRTVSTAVQVALLVGLAVLAALSARDTVRCLRGQPTDMTLKLPKFLQERIRARIRTFARSQLAIGSASFSLGVLVAGMELACTGQVYVPIVTMIAEPRYRAAAALHLLTYNLAFIAPLVAVFLLAAFGLTSQRLGRLAARHVATVKGALTLLFVALGAVVLYNLGWLG